MTTRPYQFRFLMAAPRQASTFAWSTAVRSAAAYDDSGMSCRRRGRAASQDARQRLSNSRSLRVSGRPRDRSRCFRIGSLPPGEYYVRAYLAEPVRPTRGEPSAGYAPTFFPQATRIADAQPVVVAGQDILSLNISLATVSTHVVSGRLVAPVDTALAGYIVELTPIGRDGSRAAARRRLIRWAFSHSGCRRRRIHPQGARRARCRQVARCQPPGRRRNDVAGLEIAPEAPVSIDGRFVRESGHPIDFDPGPVDVTLEYGGRDGATDMDTFSGVQRDGTFSIVAPPGSVSARIAPRGGRPYRMVKAVYLDNLEVTDRSFNLATGEHHRLTFVYFDQVSTLSGEVTDRAGHPAPYALVVVFPEDREQWKARLIRTSFAQQSGYYRWAIFRASPIERSRSRRFPATRGPIPPFSIASGCSPRPSDSRKDNSTRSRCSSCPCPRGSCHSGRIENGPLRIDRARGVTGIGASRSSAPVRRGVGQAEHAAGTTIEQLARHSRPHRLCLHIVCAAESSDESVARVLEGRASEGRVELQRGARLARTLPLAQLSNAV